MLQSLKFWIFLLCLWPLMRLAGLGLSGGLGANPIEFVTRSTGTWTLVGLLVTLTVTPLRRASGISGLIRIRRMLGLFTFFYATLHLTTYLWLDQFFDPGAILRDILQRPFIMVGMLAFLLLLPLALTSTQRMMRRLGRYWARLHKLVYAIAGLGVLHYLWLVKRDLTEPLIYASVLALLMIARLPVCARGLDRLGRRMGRTRTSHRSPV